MDVGDGHAIDGCQLPNAPPCSVQPADVDGVLRHQYSIAGHMACFEAGAGRRSHRHLSPSST